MAIITPSDNNDFFADGYKYSLDARIFYTRDGKQYDIPLTKSNIIDLEMNLSLNRLFVEGFVIYRDQFGDIGRAYGRFNLFCEINIIEYIQETDNQMNSEAYRENGTFSHLFLIDNAEILGNTTDTIFYNLKFTGIEYVKLLNNIQYSNYGQKEKDAIQIIKDVLIQAGLRADDSFDKIVSNISLNYITSGNETVQSIIDYVLQKQFYYTEAIDSTMKFVLFDLFNDKYRVFQMGVSPTTNVYNVLLSLNKTMTDELISKEKAKFASISSKRMSDILSPISKIITSSYDLKTNSFTTNEFSSEKLVQFFGGDDTNNKLNVLTTDQDMFIQRQSSDWNNDFNVYEDFVNIFTQWDSILINIGGVLSRKLMEVVSITIDNREDMTADDKTKSFDENMDRNRELMGLWYITRIRYIFKPSEGRFKQNLQLSRIANNSK